MTSAHASVGPSCLALTLLAIACAPEASSTTNAPTPAVASAAAADVATPDVVSQPEPPAPPPAPNAEPATLKLAFHGHCKSMGLSTLDDGQVVVHYDPGHWRNWSSDSVWLHRMDEHGAVAESLSFPTWDDGKGGSFDIGRVFGRWPEVRVLSEMRGRVHTEGRLHRRVGDAWRQIETVGASTDIDGAWEWVDDSILALFDKGDGYDRHDQRLAVVLGPGKGPSLAKLRRATQCEANRFQVSDVEVLADGTIVAVAACETTWIGTWAPGEAEATTTRVADTAFYGTRLHLDEQGDGFIELYSNLVRWKDGVATPLEIPGRPTVNDGTIVGVRADHAWYARGSKLWRWNETEWEPVPTPEGRRIAWVAGLGLGTPWLLFADDTVAMRTADGKWHDVALPPTPDLPEPPRATSISLTAPGDAWIEARQTKYKQGSKTIGTKLRALYTSRDAPVPVRCGKEGDAAAPSPGEADAGEGTEG